MLERFGDAMGTDGEAVVRCVVVVGRDRVGVAKAFLSALGAPPPRLAVTVVPADGAVFGALAEAAPESGTAAPGEVRLLRPDPAAGGVGTDDPFAQALGEAALSAGPDAVALFLGAGSETGGQAIEAAGGLVLRDEATEGSGGPGRGAVVPGGADALAAMLIEHVRQAGGTLPDKVSPELLPAICERVRQVTGHDFRHYKTSTLTRRVERRLNVTQSADGEAYLSLLERDADEARRLQHDMLIGVTAFFRDPEAFAALASQVLSELIREGGRSPLRVWVPGCSTGEEAYTIAMLAQDLISERGTGQELQVFATDLDERALGVARKGTYPEAVATEIGVERASRHFDRLGGRLQVRRELRSKIVFSPHDLISDPPFSRMDLISCRNLLIYLGPHLQKKLMGVFHYALKEDGYLFLGSSEAVSGHGDLFEVVDARARLGRRKRTALRSPALPRPETKRQAAEPLPPAPSDLATISQRILLDEFAPPYAIVSEEGQIAYLSAHAEVFLRPPEGEFVNDILRMTRGGLRVALRSAWSDAVRTRRTARREGLSVYKGGQSRRTRLTVQPMPEIGQGGARFMVVFEDLGEAVAEGDGTPSAADTERMVDQLEAELVVTREELERAVQDLEAANEELKSSNEELRSMNEEMQSANEELETSKEEVESGATALADANADLLNLLRSTDIATVFLDEEGRVRSFTPAASRIYALEEGDAGRPLSHFTDQLIDAPPLPGAGAEGVDEVEVRARDGRAYLRRVLPYTGAGGDRDGLVVTFVDVTDQRAARDELNATLSEIQTIYDTAPAGLCLFDEELRYVRINDALAEINGVSVEAHIGRTTGEVVPGVEDQNEAVLRQVIQTGRPVGPIEVVGETPAAPGRERTWLATYVPVGDERVERVSLSVLEITDRKESEKRAARARERLRKVTDHAPVKIAQLDANLRYRFVNARYAGLFGETASKMKGRHAAEALGPAFAEAEPYMRRALAGERCTYEIEVPSASGVRSLQAIYAPDEGADGEVEGIIAVITDISDRKEAEAAVAAREAELRQTMDGVAVLIGLLRPDGRVRYINSTAMSFVEAGMEDVEDVPFEQTPWWDLGDEHRAAVRALIERAAAGETVRQDMAWRAADGETRWVDFTMSPVTNEAGEVVAIVPSGTDITERRAWEERVAESEERLRFALQAGSAVGVYDFDAETGRMRLSERLAAFCGVRAEALTEGVPASEVADAIHPDDREDVERAMKEAAETNAPYEQEYRLAGDEERWVMAVGRPFFGEDGTLARFSGVVVDVTKRKRAELHRQLLTDELNHRVKNTLAVVQGIATQTLRGERPPAEERDAFVGRLLALSAAHDVLVREAWAGARLDEIVAKAASGCGATDRMTAEGPPIHLAPHQAVAMALAIHELCTNATKYGALSTPLGRVDVTWHTTDDGWAFAWRERGGPPVAKPSRRGFGSVLIERLLATDLKGEAEMRFEEDGLVFTASAKGSDLD